MPERALIYGWWRGRHEREGAEDLAAQEARCRAYAAVARYTIVGAYRDTTEEPGDERPELRKLRGAVWARRVDVVIATAPERIYQDVERVARLVSESRELGVRLEFLESPVMLWDR